MDAISRQGKRTDLIDEIKMLSNADEIKENGTSSLIDTKLRSNEKAGVQYGLSSASVARYVRVAFLNESLQRRVDDDEIGLYPAVSLSYLSPDEQAELNRLLYKSAYKVDMKKAEALRELSESKKLTPEKMAQVLSGELNKKPKPKTVQVFKLKAKIYQKYFDGDTPQSEIEDTIDQALAEYFENHKEAV
jgi:ParB family chromosome partitioning protein